MAQTSFPFSTSNLATSSDWLKYQRASGTADGVLATDYLVGGTALKVSANGTSTVTMQAGEAMAGGFYYNNSTAVTFTIPANATGLVRKDIVVIRADQTANTATAVYRTGGAAYPVLNASTTGQYEILLAGIDVANGVSTAPSSAVTDFRQFITPNPITTSDPLSAMNPLPDPGQLVVTPTVIGVGRYGGTITQIWPTPAPSWTAISGSSGSTNYGIPFEDVGAYKDPSGMVYARGLMKFTTLHNAGALLATMPAGFRPPTTRMFTAMAGGSGSPAGLAVRLDFRSDGGIYSLTNLGVNDYVSFDGIVFSTN